MAKAPASAPAVDAVLLTGLRRGLAGPKALNGTPASGALFPNTGPGRLKAEQAVADGYLATRTIQVPKKGRTPAREEVHYELTEKGREYILNADSPKAVLEALLPEVGKLANSAGSSSVDPAAFTQEVDKATKACLDAITTAFEKLQQAMEKAFGSFSQTIEKSLPKPASGSAVDPGPLLAMVQAAIERVKSPVPPPAPARVEVPEPAPVKIEPAPRSAALEESIVKFVNDWAQKHTVGCQFDVLWEHVKNQIPDVTVGTFQDALRKLHDAERIRLSGWSRMLDDLPQPQLALFVSSKVMYHANPG